MQIPARMTLGSCFFAAQLLLRIMISPSISVSLIADVVDRQTSLQQSEKTVSTMIALCTKMCFVVFLKDFAKDRYGVSAMVQSQQKLGWYRSYLDSPAHLNPHNE